MQNLSNSMLQLSKKSLQSFSSLYYPDQITLGSELTSFKATDLSVIRTQNPLPHPPADPNIMKFGAFHTDHLLEIDWTEQGGWQKPQIVPFKKFQIHPFASCLHYAIECFEGSKAYKNENGQLRWFRPECNMFRMKKTAERLSLPDFDGEEFIKCISNLIRIDGGWVPQVKGFSAYIRPTFIATEESLGVRAAKAAKLFCCISPVGPYFPQGFQPIKVYCNTIHVRASPGGVGQYKLGGNYAPTIHPNKISEKLGFNQSLWMLPNGQVQEMGVCNLFFFWKNKDGEEELITPVLDGTILPGVVRDSVLRLCHEMKRFKVTERQIFIDEILEAIQQNRIYDIFGTGTAVSIQPIQALGYQDKLYEVKINPNTNCGNLTYEISQKLTQIQTGQEPHPWVKII